MLMLHLHLLQQGPGMMFGLVTLEVTHILANTLSMILGEMNRNSGILIGKKWANMTYQHL
jgi:hypothetical protein